MVTKKGIIRWFNVSKGYGEILSEQNETFFFTYRELKKKAKFKSISKGKRVSFSPSEDYVFELPIAESIKEHS